MTNMTNREFYTAIINFEGMPTAMVEHAQHLIEIMDKRNETRSSKPSKTQEANAPLLSAVFEKVQASAEPITASQIFAMGIEGISSVNKVSGLLGNLYKSGKVDKREVKVKGKGKQVGYFVPHAEETTEQVDEVGEE